MTIDSDPPELREVFAPIRTNATCATFDADFESSTMLCAGAPGKSSCHGDSGGPLRGLHRAIARLRSTAS